MKTLSILLSSLLCLSSYGAIAETISIISSPVSLGTVNGDIINNEVKIERTLSNPVLLSVTKKELRLPLHAVFINNTSLLKSRQNELTFMQLSPVKHGKSMKTKVTLGLWLDGHRVNFTGKQDESAIKIVVPNPFKLLELRVVRPLELMLPKDYRGEFNFSLDIEGKSN
ncbi:DUF5462 family protein [Aliivibrio fischeri]|uniref:DUF5462 family protein n=1 Tax=Aliivibrio fischeri TaxID=668 RepID=UPI0007C519BD|nr:DUF5462 family protein [Aliivibrio fischeri]